MMRTISNWIPSTRRVWRLTIVTLFLAISLCSCRHSTSVNVIPKAPEYADTSQWFVIDRGANVDIFYIVSTEIGDYVYDDSMGQYAGVKDSIIHYADTRWEKTRQALRGEMVGVDNLLSGDLNFFSPYYRQCSLESFTSDSLMQVRTALPMSDLKRAFRYYLDTLSCGRPFILMGFSQGAMGVVELLKTMDSASYSRLVAAYVIGWKVTADDMKCPFIRPAGDSIDLGVTICYNSVAKPEGAIPMLSDGNMMSINPVNWRTDAHPARLVSPISDDTVTVVLDSATRLLIVDGYSRQDYLIPLIGCEYNYHKLEISLYRDVLRRNVAQRAQRAKLLSTP